MDRLRNFNVESLQKELKPSALKSRAAQLNDRFSSPSSSSSSNSYSATRPVQSTSGRPLPPARPSSKPSTQLTAPPGRPSSSDSVISTAPPPPPRNVGATRGRNEPTIAAGREQAHTWQPRVQGDDDGASGAASATRIDWRNLSRQDHDALFGILDNVFSGDGNPQRTALKVDSRAHVVAPPVAPPSRSSVSKHSSYSQDASRTDDASPPPPPLPPTWARPPARSATSATSSLGGPQSQEDGLSLSYPPKSETGSHAEDLAHYFGISSSEVWTAAWFQGDSPIPPPLRGRKDITWTSSWQQYGNEKTLVGSALFCDLSVAWWRVQWDASKERDRGFCHSVSRQAKYLGRPAAFAAEQLWEACSTYGERVALYAERAEQSGLPIANGECWDLANQALASITDLPGPVPSLARTHGHLVFSGKATGKDRISDQYGTWRGGDTAVRRGDIVEWRKVRIGLQNGWADLGAPDHTAIIVQAYLSSDTTANTQPGDGERLAPWEVGVLEVIEQSKGKPPSRAVYDLSGMESGEIWIYRPVSMSAYIGIDGMGADWEQPVAGRQPRLVE